MAISRDSQQEINRVKNTMFGSGKGMRAGGPRGDKFRKQYAQLECEAHGCKRMKIKWSNYCSDHTTVNAEGK